MLNYRSTYSICSSCSICSICNICNICSICSICSNCIVTTVAVVSVESCFTLHSLFLYSFLLQYSFLLPYRTPNIPHSLCFTFYALRFTLYRCKRGTGIPPGFRKDSRQYSGSHRDPAKVARFLGGFLPGKNSRHASWQESRREICTRRDPVKKKLSSGIPVSAESCREGKSWWCSRQKLNSHREKNYRIEIPAQKLHILVAETHFPARVR